MEQEFLQMALVIMSNDSASYTFLQNYKLMNRFDAEFYDSHKQMMKEQEEAN